VEVPIDVAMPPPRSTGKSAKGNKPAKDPSVEGMDITEVSHIGDLLALFARPGGENKKVEPFPGHG